jgi:hypothetical protein
MKSVMSLLAVSVCFIACQKRGFHSGNSKSNAATTDRQSISYVCSLEDGKRVEFIPSYGEVHFLKSDGSDFAPYQDGMRFKETLLAAIPRKQVMKIVDDDDNEIGRWERLLNKDAFQVTYRKTVYKNCLEVDPSAPAQTPTQTVPKVVYVCDLQGDKRVEFIPSYGEVHFLKSDGSDFAPYQDGMRFNEKILSEIPRKQVMEIVKEGNVIGKWQRFFGPEAFEIEFRNTTYGSCKEIKN